MVVRSHNPSSSGAVSRSVKETGKSLFSIKSKMAFRALVFRNPEFLHVCNKFSRSTID